MEEKRLGRGALGEGQKVDKEEDTHIGTRERTWSPRGDGTAPGERDHGGGMPVLMAGRDMDEIHSAYKYLPPVARTL